MHFEFSDKVKELQSRLLVFMDEHIYPNERVYAEQVSQGDRWQPVGIMEELKLKARAAGLWNLFLPESEWGAGLTNVEYAPLCEIMGRSAMAPGMRLLIVEQILEPDPARGRPLDYLVDIQMMAMFGSACERTVPEFRALLEQAGFVLERVMQIASPVWILVAAAASDSV